MLSHPFQHPSVDVFGIPRDIKRCIKLNHKFFIPMDAFGAELKQLGMMQILKHIVEAGDVLHILMRNKLMRKNLLSLEEDGCIIVLLGSCPEPQKLAGWRGVVRILNPSLKVAHGVEECIRVEGGTSISFKISVEWPLLLWTQSNG